MKHRCYRLVEFEGEYVEGNLKISQEHSNIKLQLQEENLTLTRNSVLFDDSLHSIPYGEVSSVQNILHKEIRSSMKALLVLVVIGLVFLVVFNGFLGLVVFGLLVLAVLGLITFSWRKSVPLLTLTFKDDVDMEQTAVFKMKEPQEAYAAVYDKVVEAKKKKHGK